MGVHNNDDVEGTDCAAARLADSYTRWLKDEIGGVVLISGPSGAGKTSLAFSLKDNISQHGGHMICGKFDQLAYNCEATTTLYEPFVDAFTSYIEDIVVAGKDALKSVREALEAALDLTERQVLHDMIPALCKLLPVRKSHGVVTNSPVIKGPDAESRFVRIFGRFVKALCSSGTPIVLFLDDVHWASQSDLNLTASLVELGKAHHESRLMLLCTYRSNDTPPDHPWSILVNKIKDGGTSVTEMEVINKIETEVATILSKALNRPFIDVKSLSTVVFEHTGGNILFVKMLLDEFKDGVLSSISIQDLENVQLCLEHQCHSVEMLVVTKMKRLPISAQELLKVASCLGSKFSEGILTAVSGEWILPTLLILQDASLITFDSKSKVGHFSHDRFQQTVYSLIDENERAACHLRVGRTLWQRLAQELRDNNLVLIGHQISRGAHLLTSPNEKIETAEILSQAGQKAAVSSAFATAATFLNFGISLLCKERWILHYDLCLHLYSFAAEIEYYNGKLKRVDELVAEVLHNAKSLEDKLKAHFTRIYSLGSRNEMDKALKESLDVFKSLGETFPRHPGTSHIVVGVIRCSYALRGKSDEYIMNLPQMKDKTRLAGMRLMAVVFLYAFYLRDKIFPLMAFRLVTNTLRYGMSDIACVGFALWAYVCARRGDVDNACRYGRLALRIYEKYEAKEWQTRVILTVYHTIFPLRHPYSKLQAHCAGLVFGDLHLSMVNAVAHADLSYLAGAPLESILKNLVTCCSICRQYRQLTVLAAAELRMQFCLNLLGRSEDVLILSGDAMREEDVAAAMKEKNRQYYSWLHVLKLTLAVYMNNLPAAQDMSRRLKLLDTSETLQCFAAAYLFFDGMVAAMSSRTSRKEKKRAARILVKLKKFADNAPSNYLHRVYLVEAEMLTSAGQYNEALTKYQRSITLAGRHGLIHEQALACERASHMLLRWQRPNEAQEYVLKAQSLYDEWGAKVKSNQLASVVSTPQQSLGPIHSLN